MAILVEIASYGYAILKRAGELSGGHPKWTMVCLIPYCIGLDDSAMSSRGEPRKAEGKRKYYRISKEGRGHPAVQWKQRQVEVDTLHRIRREAAPAAGSV